MFTLNRNIVAEATGVAEIEALVLNERVYR